MVKITSSMSEKINKILDLGYNFVEVIIENNNKNERYEFFRNYDFYKKVNEILGDK